MASRSVNKVILLGNLGRDAETKFTASGVARCTFSVATTRRLKDQQTGEWRDETDWHNIVLWRAENLANYLTKGARVYIEGRLQTRSYDDKDGNKRYMTEVVAEELILVGGRGDAPGADPVSAPRPVSQRPEPYHTPDQSSASEPQFPEVASEDDVPF